MVPEGSEGPFHKHGHSLSMNWSGPPFISASSVFKFSGQPEDVVILDELGFVPLAMTKRGTSFRDVVKVNCVKAESTFGTLVS